MQFRSDYPPNSTTIIWSCIARLCVFLIALAPFLIQAQTAGEAQTEDSFKILVLHGRWDVGGWTQRFDQQFSRTLTERADISCRVSFRGLTIGSLADAQAVDFYRQTVNGIVETDGVDLIVAVLPAAVEFVKTLDAYMSLPMVLAVSLEDDDDLGLPEDLFRVVQSSAESLIRNTLQLATQLHPEASIIQVFGASVMEDLHGLELTQQIVEQEFSDYELISHAGMSPEDLQNYLGTLSADSIVLTLPYLLSGVSRSQNGTAPLRQLAAASSRPLYSFVDTFLGEGLAGGYFHTVEDYAAASAEAVISLAISVPSDPQQKGLVGSYIFDHNEVERHDLKLDRLAVPYVVRYRPLSLLEEHRSSIYAMTLVFLLLGVAMYLLFNALKKSEIVKEQLRVSERQARESQMRYQLLTENTQDVIWTWDQETLQTTYCSPAIERLSGYKPEEFMNLRMHDVVAEGSFDAASQLVFSSRQESRLYEVELMRKDGGKIWCEVAAQLIINEDKSVTQWVGITRDISKRKQEENDRLVLEGQLRQAQKFESLGTLAGGIAHDFNNMLGVMVGLNELLKLQVSDKPSAVAIIDRLMATTDKAKVLVGHILAFSRQSNLNKVGFDIIELADDSLQLVQSGILKSIKLRHELTCNPIRVFADPNQMSQVFMIILTNAYEALEQEQGEIDFSVSEVDFSKARECLHGRLEPGRYAKITVTDNGLGVSKDRIDKIFDPFYTSKDAGSGMGLSIARGIVIAHDGGIDFNSEPFKGSTISIYLPVSNVKEITAPEPMNDSKPNRSTILLIDDQVDLLETVGMMLGVIGHDCIQYSDPREAMDVIAKGRVQFDMVITDYSMPDMSGLDVANLCAEKRPSIPVIIATGYNDPAAFISGDDSSEYHILSKPFGFDELKAIIDKVLGGKTS